MGTRHLTCVFSNDKMRVAQYGQFDGYPDGAGRNICDFIQSNDMNAFSSKIEKVTQISEEDLKKIHSNFSSNDGWMTLEESNRFAAQHPEFHRNTGSDILSLIMKSEEGLRVNLATDFANDSLFCEYAYVVNLDTNMLEFYKGFQKEVHSRGRFASSDSSEDGYYPVKLVDEVSFEKIKEKGFAALEEVLPNKEEA